MELIYFTAVYSFGYILCYINNTMEHTSIEQYITILANHSIKIQNELVNAQIEIQRLGNVIDNISLTLERVIDEIIEKNK